MLVDSIIIKMIKGGAGVGSDYSITIYGHGKVFYEGKENVRITGTVENPIEKNEIISLLSEFKRIGFFTLQEEYIAKDPAMRPYTIISISIPKENGEILTKRVIRYQGETNAPKGLIALEDKIDETVGSKRWVGDITNQAGFAGYSSEPIRKTPVSDSEKEISKKTKKSSSTFVATGVVILVVAMILLSAFYFGIISFSANTENNSNNINITYLATADIVTTGQIQTGENFQQGQTVHVIILYENITTAENSTQCDIFIKIKVLLNSTIIEEMQKSDLEYEYAEEDYSDISFQTDSSWEPGKYEISVNLQDNLSKKSTGATTYFNLTRKKLQIADLQPASEIRGIDDYDWNIGFSQGDIVYIYQEHDGFAIENEECNLTMELIVKYEGNVKYQNETYERNPENIGHKWWFTTDDTWEPGLYYVTLNLTDNIAKQSVSKNILFRINE